MSHIWLTSPLPYVRPNMAIPCRPWRRDVDVEGQARPGCPSARAAVGHPPPGQKPWQTHHRIMVPHHCHKLKLELWYHCQCHITTAHRFIITGCTITRVNEKIENDPKPSFHCPVFKSGVWSRCGSLIEYVCNPLTILWATWWKKTFTVPHHAAMYQIQSLWVSD